LNAIGVRMDENGNFGGDATGNVGDENGNGNFATDIETVREVKKNVIKNVDPVKITNQIRQRIAPTRDKKRVHQLLDKMEQGKITKAQDYEKLRDTIKFSQKDSNSLQQEQFLMDQFLKNNTKLMKKMKMYYGGKCIGLRINMYQRKRDMQVDTDHEM